MDKQTISSAAPDGTIQGEFGFATADGFYLTTKYATDERGNFVIRERTRETLGGCLFYRAVQKNGSQVA